MFAPRLSPEEREILQAGGCAMLDFWATFGFGPTEVTIEVWMLAQAVDLASHPEQVIRRKLIAISMMPNEEQTEEQRNQQMAQVLGIACV
jgi:hypothetical protein